MRFYVDSEFIERGYSRIELISIGLAAQDGRTYYAIAADGWEARVDDWVYENVLPHLGVERRKMRSRIAQEIIEFCGKDPEFWGYFCDYDWVVLCQLFGRMVDLPEGWPKFCLDVKQVMFEKNVKRADMPVQKGTEHHALADALHIKLMHEHLIGLAAAGL